SRRRAVARFSATCHRSAPAPVPCTRPRHRAHGCRGPRRLPGANRAATRLARLASFVHAVGARPAARTRTKGEAVKRTLSAVLATALLGTGLARAQDVTPTPAPQGGAPSD